MLTVENGSFSYGNHIILDNISFSAGQGDLIAILGPNGAGKTTLLRCIMGMLKWKSGKCSVDGKNINSFSSRELWKIISYVPQARSVATSQTALQSVLLGRSSSISLFESPKIRDIEYSMEIMSQLGIEHLADKSCSEMSGGELQMVLIARALASDPRILILDEPESNLDFRNQLIVLNTMSSLAERGMSCIFNTHYPAHALQRANKSLVLQKGGTYYFGDTGSTVTERIIQQAFGVRTAIGEIETENTILQSVVPIRLASDGQTSPEDDKSQAFASMTIIFKENRSSVKLNEILHEYEGYIVGRMGMPYKQYGLFVIHLNMDAPKDKIRKLCRRISIMQEVSVKVTYAVDNGRGFSDEEHLRNGD